MGVRVSKIVLAGSFILAMLSAAPAFAKDAPAGSVTPTSFSVFNGTWGMVFANLILGQPPVTPPPNCSSLGSQITQVTDLVFTSSLGKTVSFTPVGDGSKGWYPMDSHEVITYEPQMSCGADCTPAVTFNFFFTQSSSGFEANNGCSNSTFPNATNLAEGSVNFAINGSVGSGCANADDTDISAVNGVNSTIEIVTEGDDWPSATSDAANGPLGKNANMPGVFGWAAPNCSGDKANEGYPNPTASCAAPVDAPRLPSGQTQCQTPNGATYDPITFDGVSYCDQRSDAGTCNNQRAAGVTGGIVRIGVYGFIAPSSGSVAAAEAPAGPER